MNVQYLLAPGSADDIIWSLVQSKLRVVGNALDGHLAGTATGKSQPQTCPCLCLHTYNIVVGLDLLWLVWGGMPYPLNFKLCFSSIILVQSNRICCPEVLPTRACASCSSIAKVNSEHT